MMKQRSNVLNKKNLRSWLHIMVFSFALLNCEAAYNCLRDIKPPELPVKELKTGYLGQPYSDKLIPLVTQLPGVGGYYFDLEIEGKLPEGIGVFVGRGNIVFEGVPTQIGVYDFTILLNINPVDGGTSLCDNQASKAYTIQIK